MSADGVIGFYERNAQTWASDRSRMRLLFEKAWLDRFTVLVPAGATILDLGCGFGKPIAAYLPSQGGIMARDSFFHLDHDAQRRMFPIFREHAKPGAPLMFTSGPRHGEAVGNLFGEPLYHASLPPEEYRALARHERFRRCRCPHGRSGLRPPFSLAGAARRRLGRA